MDVFMGNRENMRTWMRTGLTWLDDECGKRFSKTFVDCDARNAPPCWTTLPVRVAPKRNAGWRPLLQQRLAFCRLLVEQDGCRRPAVPGNRPVAQWNGCPAPTLNKLEVRYS
jgi:hypothetical protein